MTILQLIRQYDFSTAYCVLVPSVPGRHRANEMHEYGYLKLRKAVIQHAVQSQTSSPILCQFSSIGSLNGKWLSQVSLFDFACLSLAHSDTHNRNYSVFVVFGFFDGPII